MVSRAVATLAVTVLCACTIVVPGGGIPCEPGTACPGGMACGAEGACVAEPAPRTVPCTANADCPDDSVCLDGACSRIGECTRDEHCDCSAPVCSDHVCVGAPTCTTTPPTTCEINAGCPSRTYCVGGICQLTTECLRHADCALGNGCFRTLCWSL